MLSEQNVENSTPNMVNFKLFIRNSIDFMHGNVILILCLCWISFLVQRITICRSMSTGRFFYEIHCHEENIPVTDNALCERQTV